MMPLDMSAVGSRTPGTVARIVPDVTGLDRTFDYTVPDEMIGLIEVGCRVRVNLNGRRVGAWVQSLSATSAIGDVSVLKPLSKSSGIGPDADMMDLCSWAAWRWCTGKLRPFLIAASPHTVVTRPSPKRRTRVVAEPSSPAATSLLAQGGGVLRLAPTVDQLPAILSAAHFGPVLVVCPSIDMARILAARLRRSGVSVATMPEDWAHARGGVDVVIGARGTAFAPCPEMAAAVVVDEHDESLQEERMPTWNARDVVAERCRRLGVPLLQISPCPSVVGAQGRRIVAPPIDRERAGWPEFLVIDMNEQPLQGSTLLSGELISILRDSSLRVACVHDVKGYVQLLACRSCKELLRCEVCSSAMSERATGDLSCDVCRTTRPRVCANCAATSLVRLRPGVTRLREEMEKSAARTVVAVEGKQRRSEDSKSDFDDGQVDVFVGTQAVLHRVRGVDVVAFLDFDRNLLAPRFRAAEQSLGLLARASRLVGPKSRGGRVLIQTTLPDHDVIRAVTLGDLSQFLENERGRRQQLAMPPFAAIALVEGEGTDDFSRAVQEHEGIRAVRYHDTVLLRAGTHEILADACEQVPRQIRSRVRIEVDPMSV